MSHRSGRPMNPVKRFVKKAIARRGYAILRADSSDILAFYHAGYLSGACQPRTVIDVGVGYGTYSLYEAFPDSYFVLIEQLFDYQSSIERILERYRGEVHYIALGRGELRPR
jgi:hypothetical protein